MKLLDPWSEWMIHVIIMENLCESMVEGAWASLAA